MGVMSSDIDAGPGVVELLGLLLEYSATDYKIIKN